MEKFIPLSIPNFEGNEKKYVDDALEQGWVSTGGEYINRLEKNLAKFLNVDNVAACQSGTSALHLSLVDIGVGPDDIVLVSPLTFIAAVNPIRYQFAEPVFIDCDDSFCIDPIKLKKFCQEECNYVDGRLVHKGHIVKAVVVVHIFGNMADMESIMDVAKTYNLKVVEDATEALGTYYTSGRYEGKYAGTIGHYGAYSFNGNKIITTGGGGAITANDSQVVDHIRYLSTQAKDDPCFYIHNEVGFNYRMTNLQAALGVAQVEKLPEFIAMKQSNYDLYKKEFAGFELASLIEFRQGTESNKWFYSLEINRDKVTVSMSDIISKLQEKGVQTRAIWGLINEQKPYLQFESYMVEKAVYYAERILNIPCSTQITKEEIIYVSSEIKHLLEELADE